MTPSKFDAFVKTMTQPWVVLTYALAMVGIFIYVDAPVALFFYQIELGHIRPASQWITCLGKVKPLLGILLVSVLMFRYVFRVKKWEMRLWFLCLTTFVPSLVVMGLKVIFGRARPELLFQDHLYGFQWFEYSRPFWSFPSGHTATLMGCMFGAFILFPKYRWVFLGVGLLVMTTRVILLQHYITDVLVSAYLAMLEVWLLHFVLQRYAPAFMKEVRG